MTNTYHRETDLPTLVPSVTPAYAIAPTLDGPTEELLAELRRAYRVVSHLEAVRDVHILRSGGRTRGIEVCARLRAAIAGEHEIIRSIQGTLKARCGG